MAANRNLKQVRIENSSPAAPLGMVGGGGGGGNLKGLRGLEAESEAAAAAMALAPGKEGGRDEEQEVGFTIDIKSFLKPGEKSYTQRCRLFVGNLPTDITEEDFKRLFERYGEPSEVFINRDRGFGFIRLVRIRTGLWGCPVTLGLCPKARGFGPSPPATFPSFSDGIKKGSICLSFSSSSLLALVPPAPSSFFPHPVRLYVWSKPDLCIQTGPPSSWRFGPRLSPWHLKGLILKNGQDCFEMQLLARRERRT